MKNLTETQTRIKFLPRKNGFFNKIPRLPGVYVFEDEKQKALYVGKSINLRTRIRQHLKEAEEVKNSKQAVFLPQAKNLSFVVAVNDTVALLLEAELIKIYAPKYNSLAKDDKSSVYISVSNAPEYRISLVRAGDLHRNVFDKPQSQIYGPFQNTKVAKEILRLSRRIFGFCDRPSNSERACFYYHLDQCPGRCVGKMSDDEYGKHMERIKKFLSGKVKSLEISIKKEINTLANEKRFEEAEKMKEQYDLLKQIIAMPKVSQFLKLPSDNTRLLKMIETTLNHPY